MKRIVIIFAVCLWCLTSTNSFGTTLENGLLQYNWGASSSKYSGLKQVGVKEDVRYFSKPGESYTVGKVSIDDVVYGFYQDQLFGVYLKIDSPEVYDKLFNHLKSVYGLPATKLTADDQSVYKWKQKDVTVKLKLNKQTEKMKLSFYYRPLSKQLNAKQWEDLDTSSFRFVPIEKDKKPEKFVLFEF